MTWRMGHYSLRSVGVGHLKSRVVPDLASRHNVGTVARHLFLQSSNEQAITFRGSVRMRLQIRSVLATGEILKVLLPTVVSIAIVIPGGDVGYSQSPPRQQVRLFTAVDLNPSEFNFTVANGIFGEQQVGESNPTGVGEPNHALLWRGSAASVVDLHVYLPPDFARSSANGINATGDIVGEARSKDVGYGMPVYNLVHAFLWKRNAPTPGAPRGQDTMGCENRP